MNSSDQNKENARNAYLDGSLVLNTPKRTPLSKTKLRESVRLTKQRLCQWVKDNDDAR